MEITRIYNIALFGGTFDPFHMGHYELLKNFNEEIKSDKIYVIPAGHPYFKENEGKKVSSAADRIEMTKTGLKDLDIPWEISTVETDKDTPSYSIETIRYFRKKGIPKETGAGHLKIWFLCGSDLLFEIDKWYKYEEILSSVTLAVIPRGDDDIEEILDYVTTWNVDGMILFCMLNDDAIRVQQQFKKPIACVDAYISKEVEDKFGDKFINIALDDEEGVYNCISYLIDNGHRKIGFYSDNIEGVNAARLRGYKRALMDHGIKPTKDDIFKFDPSLKMHDISLNKMIDKAKDYTAVFCTSDMYAVELMNGCILKGINVPDDLSIIGVDDTLISKVARPQLTTLHQSPKEKGKLAAVKIMEFINGENAEEHQIILKSHLVIRDSVKNIK